MPNAPPANGTASVRGVVEDVGSTPVAGATVTLTGPGGFLQKTLSADDGSYQVEGLPAGSFTLKVVAEGLTGESIALDLAPAEQKVLPAFMLKIPTANFQVDAISQSQMADRQLKQEETQRLLGVIPNFYVIYDHHAVPLTTAQKYKLAWRSTIDPVNYAITGGVAGIEYAQNTFAGYGRGFPGYAKRYGAGVANFAIGDMLGGAVYPSWFKQDPRYFYMGKEGGSVFRRFSYAMSTSVIAKGDNGKWQPAYASVLGDFSSGAASYLYYPASDKSGAGLFLTNSLLAVVFDGVGNVFQEFVLKHVTPGTPKTP